MVMWSLLLYGVPILLAVWQGWTAAKAPPETIAEALSAIGLMLLWTMGWVALYLFAFVGVFASGFTLRGPLYLLGQTAIYWLPVAVIAYIIRAQRERAA